MARRDLVRANVANTGGVIEEVYAQKSGARHIHISVASRTSFR